jgi:hypothetical protein
LREIPLVKNLKLLLFAIFVLLACPLSAAATTLTVQSQTINNVFAPGISASNPPTLRIYATRPFISNDTPPGVVPSGTPQNGAYYLAIACTYSAGVVTIPSFSLICTTDSPTAPDALYNFYLYLGSSQILPNPLAFMSGIQCPATLTSHTNCSPFSHCADFQDLYQASHGIPIPSVSQLTYNAPTIDAKLAAVAAALMGAPTNSGYILKTPDLTHLPNSQALSSLATGIIKNTTATGVLSTAVPNTDYQLPISATSPLTFISNTVALPSSSGSTSGYLSSTDWTTFNSKQAALGFTPENLANKNATNGYAGLSSGKLALSQGQEVWALSDLSDVSAKQGNATVVQMFGGGSPATNDCAKFDASGNLVSAGAACGSGSGGGTVTTLSVVSANGFAGSVATATTTPAITVSTTITGLLKGNGTAVSAAAAGTDYPGLASTNSFSGVNAFSNTFTVSGAATFSASLDAIIKTSTQASLPTPGSTGRLYYQTDGLRGSVFDNGTFWYRAFPLVNIQAFGAKFDGLIVGDGSCTSSSTTIGSASAGWSAASINMKLVAKGCGVAGAPLVATITSVIDSSHVVVSPAASTTASPVNVYFGTDDTTAWNAAITALGTNGGTLQLPIGKSILTAKITFGDGTNTTISSKNHIQTVGQGGNKTQIAFNGGATEIWGVYSSDPGAVFQVDGPYSGWGLSGIFVDAGVGSASASNVVLWNHCHKCFVRDFSFTGHKAFAIDITTRSTGIAGVNVGSDDNEIANGWIAAPTATTGGGIRGGAADTTNYGTSRLSIRNVWAYSGSDATAAAIVARFGDAWTLENVTTKSTGSGIGFQAVAATSNSAYPSAINFIGNVALQGNVAKSGTFGPLDKIVLWGYSLADSESIPTDTGFMGMTTRGKFFIPGGSYSFQQAPTFDTMTAGSLLYAGASGLLSQNNSKLFWDNSGVQLGIGTATPGRSLHIKTSSGNAGVRLDNSTASFFIYAGSGASGFGIFDENAGVDRLAINSSGQVGIGIAPLTNFHVETSSETEMRVRGNSPRIAMYSNNGDTGERNWAFRSNNTAFGDFGIYQSTTQGGDPYNSGSGNRYLYINKVGVPGFFKGADVASASTITPTGFLFHVTGTTGITAISTTGIQAGTCINVIFDGVLTLTNSSTLKLASTTNYTTTAGTAMIWCWDGSAWQEFARAQR